MYVLKVESDYKSLLAFKILSEKSINLGKLRQDYPWLNFETVESVLLVSDSKDLMLISQNTFKKLNKKIYSGSIFVKFTT